ncbi:response regulator [Candidatus Nitronereus thalassa]|uniref:Response regulator n=1 Tax=Candidatus Nitronereus thalassa TaxID=3020898 RepID=A0ABU3KB45_9BACT|nr:response regulator [Candidatus Nitronereus thalassa]MDT7043635.1 response regulator [Candidatus Nitronereus thalassa]
MIHSDTSLASTREEEAVPSPLAAFPPDSTKSGPVSIAQGNHQSRIILMVDDDSDDCLLAQEAWEEIQSGNELRFIHDGQAVLNYLYHYGEFAHAQSAPRPGIILLDLNMPKKNGHEVLGILKKDQDLYTIPIVVFTTTRNSEEIFRAYQEGANAFMTKPTSFEGYRDTLLALDYYWLHLVQLPQP